MNDILLLFLFSLVGVAGFFLGGYFSNLKRKSDHIALSTKLEQLQQQNQQAQLNLQRAIERLNQRQRQHGGRGGRRRNRNRGGR